MKNLLANLHAHLFGLILLTVACTAEAQVEIPLVLHYDGSDDLRIGIEVSFQAGSGTTEPKLFLFDTGSSSLITNTGVDLGTSSNTGNSSIASYGIATSSNHPFNEYSGAVVFHDRAGQPVPVSNVNFGSSYNTATYPNGGTVANGDFHGIIGAGLAPDHFSGDPSDFYLYSIFGQIPAGSGLKSGFTVDVASGTKSLYLGVSDAQIANFTATAPLNPTYNIPTEYNTFPNTGYQAYNQKQINTTISFDGQNLSSEAIPTTIDSGAPDAAIVEGPGHSIEPHITVPNVPSEYLTTFEDNSVLVDGTNFAVGAFGGGSLYEYLAKVLKDPALVKVDDQPDGTDGHLNTGIEPFLSYQITFLFDDGTGKGIVGFTAVPEPATYALGLGWATVAVLICQRRRQKFRNA
ncbi:hypothetical protein [Cerasicoccus arenae]|uniref:PEP-CTERM sorting domain-containing protein n=1 Tax=Cerasicoccus arenae TaxID=424488 RepID=A0A8J3DJK3_9BACT|nr:hypothetical protein [Cerasicoccus arenae]MBK1859393.1 hypothetical protein [Cerasicoccus arenae]GHC10727.1 hypothetical protein GCM10007047_30060 [Cerasicoccus arenae]